MKSPQDKLLAKDGWPEFIQRPNNFQTFILDGNTCLSLGNNFLVRYTGNPQLANRLFRNFICRSVVWNAQWFFFHINNIVSGSEGPRPAPKFLFNPYLARITQEGIAENKDRTVFFAYLWDIPVEIESRGDDRQWYPGWLTVLEPRLGYILGYILAVLTLGRSLNLSSQGPHP